MKKYNSIQTSRFAGIAGREAARRQEANYERFMQGRADVFQVTEGKTQALFWAMQNP